MTEVLTEAQKRAIHAMVDAAPLLTAEQREQLRPILAGTLPAPPVDESALRHAHPEQQQRYHQPCKDD